MCQADLNVDDLIPGETLHYFSRDSSHEEEEEKEKAGKVKKAGRQKRAGEVGETIRCPFSGEVFESKEALFLSWGRLYRRAFELLFAPEAVASFREFRVEVQKEWAAQAEGQGPSLAGKFQCCFCPTRTLKTKRDFFAHMRSAHQDRFSAVFHEASSPFLCDSAGCSEGFHSANALKLHRQSHQGTRCPFSLGGVVCNRSFYEYRNLLQHYLVHIKSEIRCDYCLYAYEEEAKLKELRNQMAQ